MSHHPERTARNVRPVNQPPSLYNGGQWGKTDALSFLKAKGGGRKSFRACEDRPSVRFARRGGLVRGRSSQAARLMRRGTAERSETAAGRARDELQPAAEPLQA